MSGWLEVSQFLGIIQAGSTQYYVHDFRASVQKKAINDTQDLTVDETGRHASQRPGAAAGRKCVAWCSNVVRRRGNETLGSPICGVIASSFMAAWSAHARFSSLRRGCVHPREHYTCSAVGNGVEGSICICHYAVTAYGLRQRQ